MKLQDEIGYGADGRSANGAPMAELGRWHEATTCTLEHVAGVSHADRRRARPGMVIAGIAFVLFVLLAVASKGCS